MLIRTLASLVVPSCAPSVAPMAGHGIAPVASAFASALPAVATTPTTGRPVASGAAAEHPRRVERRHLLGFGVAGREVGRLDEATLRHGTTILSVVAGYARSRNAAGSIRLFLTRVVTTI